MACQCSSRMLPGCKPHRHRGDSLGHRKLVDVGFFRRARRIHAALPDLPSHSGRREVRRWGNLNWACCCNSVCRPLGLRYSIDRIVSQADGVGGIFCPFGAEVGKVGAPGSAQRIALARKGPNLSTAGARKSLGARCSFAGGPVLKITTVREVAWEAVSGVEPRPSPNLSLGGRGVFVATNRRRQACDGSGVHGHAACLPDCYYRAASTGVSTWLAAPSCCSPHANPVAGQSQAANGFPFGRLVTWGDGEHSC